MFQFPRFPSPGLCVQPGDDAGDLRPDAGFPHSDIPGSQPAHGSPKLIAVFHVLLRHLAPRHPPYALSSLTIRDAEKLTFFFAAIQLLRCVWRLSRLGGSTAERWYSEASLGLTPRGSTAPSTLEPDTSPGPGSTRRKCATCLFSSGKQFVSQSFINSDRPGGDEGIRTPGLRRAKAALSQLSYIPIVRQKPPILVLAVGLSGFEPETCPLSEERSNQLS